MRARLQLRTLVKFLALVSLVVAGRSPAAEPPRDALEQAPAAAAPPPVNSARLTLNTKRRPLNGLLWNVQLLAGAAAWRASDTAPGGNRLTAPAIGFGMWFGYLIDDWAVLGEWAMHWPISASLTGDGQRVPIPDDLEVVSFGVGVARYRLSDLDFNVALGAGLIRMLTSEQRADGKPMSAIGPMGFLQVGKDWTWRDGHLGLGLTLRAQYGVSRASADFLNIKNWQAASVLGGFTMSLLGLE
jgi:hypothetical protein